MHTHVYAKASSIVCACVWAGVVREEYNAVFIYYFWGFMETYLLVLWSAVRCLPLTVR